LLKGDFGGIVRARLLPQATMHHIRQDLFAFIYHAAGIPIAASALYPTFGLLLSPIIAGATVAISSVSVVGNALRAAYDTPLIGNLLIGQAECPHLVHRVHHAILSVLRRLDVQTESEDWLLALANVVVSWCQGPIERKGYEVSQLYNWLFSMLAGSHGATVWRQCTIYVGPFAPG
jgi:hypothetical protein